MPEELDQIVKKFDAAWTAGEKPIVSEFLELADDTERTELLEQLLVIDIDRRNRAGESVDASDYTSLGPAAMEFAEKSLRQWCEKAEPVTQDSSGDRELSATSGPTTEPPKSKQVGPYKLLQQLGEGGMGTVWMAEQEKPVRRRVALKLIRAGIDNKQIIARFEAERQALAMMDHHNIAKVLDAGATDSGQPYFVMELVQGIPFTQYCDKNKLSIEERLNLFIPVCKAIQHAHQKGIIHRDLKPSNVLVCLYDGKPVPKVIDFGLAKALQQTQRLTDKTMFTEFGQVVGTLQYMSPEQAEMNQLDVDTRTDIYSLGVMLYELLTGSTPIEKELVREQAIFKVLETIREQEPPQTRSIRLSSATQEASTTISAQRRIDTGKLKSILRGELDWIVMKALEKDRSRRYETANSFADDIEHYLNNEVVTARPPSMVYRLRKYIRKNKGLVASLAAIAAILLIGLISATFLWLDAKAARKLADEHAIEVFKENQRVSKNEIRAIENEGPPPPAVEPARQADPVKQLSEQLTPRHLMSLNAKGIDGVKEVASFTQQERINALAISPMARLMIGESALVVGNTSDAIAQMRRSINDGGDMAFYFKSLGWALAVAGEQEEAAMVLTRALQKSPADANDSEEVERDEKNHAHWTAAYFLHRVETEEYVNRWVTNDSDTSLAANIWFYVGQRHEIDGDMNAALAAYEKSIDLAGTEILEQRYKAWSELRLETVGRRLIELLTPRYLSSITAKGANGAKEVASLAQDDNLNTLAIIPLARLIMGENAFVNGNSKVAIAQMRRAIKDGGVKPSYFKSLGCALAAVGEQEEAETALLRALQKTTDEASEGEEVERDEMNHDHWTAAYLLRRVQTDEYVDRWVTSDPATTLGAFVWFYVGQRHEIDGKVNDALAAYRKSIDLAGTEIAEQKCKAWSELRVEKLGRQKVKND